MTTPTALELITLTLQRFVTAGTLDDCVGAPCWVQATGYNGTTAMSPVMTPVFFLRSEPMAIDIVESPPFADHEVVTVSGRGLADGQTYQLMQCGDFELGCDRSVAQVVVGDADGRFTTTLELRARINALAAVDCGLAAPGYCRLMLVNTAVFLDLAFEGLSFESSPISYFFNHSLRPGARLPIFGRLESNTAYELEECGPIAGGVAIETCLTLVRGTTDGNGSYANTPRLHQAFLGSGPVNCRMSACRVRVVTAGVERGSFPILFLPIVTVLDTSVSERDGVARARIELSGPAGQTVRVFLHTQDITAFSGADYTAFDAWVDIAPGDVSASVDIPLVDDGPGESSERFAVTILDYRGARLGALLDSKRGIITINDR